MDKHKKVTKKSDKQKKNLSEDLSFSHFSFFSKDEKKISSLIIQRERKKNHSYEKHPKIKDS